MSGVPSDSDPTATTGRLTYVGHATTLLRLGGTSVLTDPLLRRRLGPLRRRGAAPGPPPRLDLVLISHLHRDHLDLPSLRLLPPGTEVIVPRHAAGLVAGGSEARVRELDEGDAVSIGGLTVTAVPAVHDDRRDPWSRGPRAQPLGYLIEAGGYRAYFAGDTDIFPGMAELGPLDLALLPVWGWGPTLGEGHLDPARAAGAHGLLRPRLTVPIHWGTLYPLGLRRLHPGRLTEPPLEFARLTSAAAPGAEVRVLEPGESMELP